VLARVCSPGQQSGWRARVTGVSLHWRVTPQSLRSDWRVTPVAGGLSCRGVLRASDAAGVEGRTDVECAPQTVTGGGGPTRQRGADETVVGREGGGDGETKAVTARDGETKA
jgi:hypothetical protein